MHLSIQYLLATAAVLSACNSKLIELGDYCDHPDCVLKGQHTACAMRNTTSPRLFAVGMTAWMRSQALLLHNRHRDSVASGLETGHPPATNMRKMYWDDELETIADLWARQCQFRHDECRNARRFNVLQNIDVRPVVPRMTQAQLLADAIGVWYSGSRLLQPERVKFFRLGKCSAPGGCNVNWHAAASWAPTWRLGCSQALCMASKQFCSPKTLDEPVGRNVSDNKKVKFGKRSRRRPERESLSQKQINVRSNNQERNSKSDEAQTKDDMNIYAYTVCNYGPAGNIEGMPIYESGTPCTNCQRGTRCLDPTLRSLCALTASDNCDPKLQPKL